MRPIHEWADWRWGTPCWSWYQKTATRALKMQQQASHKSFNRRLTSLSERIRFDFMGKFNVPSVTAKDTPPPLKRDPPPLCKKIHPPPPKETYVTMKQNAINWMIPWESLTVNWCGLVRHIRYRISAEKCFKIFFIFSTILEKKKTFTWKNAGQQKEPKMKDGEFETHRHRSGA